MSEDAKKPADPETEGNGGSEPEDEEAVELGNIGKKVIARMLLLGRRLYMNPVTKEALEHVRTGNEALKPKVRRDDPLEEVCSERLYTDPGGRMVIPMMNLHSCAVEAGRGVPFKSKRQVSTSRTSLFGGLVRLVGDYIYLFDPLNPQQPPRWVPTGVPGKNPDSKGLVCISRPMIERWAGWVFMTIRSGVIKSDVVLEIFQKGGALAGLGDWRIDRKGQAGTFEVFRWDIFDTVEEAKQADLLGHLRALTEYQLRLQAEDEALLTLCDPTKLLA